MNRNDCARNVPTKRLLSLKDLVQEFGVSMWFWRTQIWDGKLPFVQVGRKILVDVQDVEKFIDSEKQSHYF
jgi:hypothetical protein